MRLRFKRALSVAVVLTALILAPPTAASARETIAVRLDPVVVYVGQHSRMTIEVLSTSQPVPEPQLPQIEHLTFRLAGTPAQGFRTINNYTEYSKTFSYFVTATEPGLYEIYPVAVDKNGKTTFANKATLKVLQPGDKTPDYFLKIKADKTDAYVGEPVLLTFQQYSRVKPTGDIKLDLDANVFKGFWHEIVPNEKLTYRQEAVGSAQYYVVDIQQVIVFPLTSGEVTIEPVSLDSVLEYPRQQTRSRRPNIFDNFGFDSVFGSRDLKRVQMLSNALKLNVHPLPSQGRPEDFSGAVGLYRLAAKVDKPELKAGEPLTLTVTVQGQGNLKNLPEPTLPDLEGFERFESTKKENLSVAGGSPQGQVSYEYLLVPRSAESNVIGPVRLDYFNTALKKYLTEQTESIALNVLPSERGLEESIVIGSGRHRREIRVVGEDLRYIHTERPDLDSDRGKGPGPVLLVSLHVLPLAFVGVFGFFLWRQRRQEADPVWARQRQAPRVARRALRQCEQFLNDQQVESFYGALQRALMQYLSNRSGISLQGLQVEQRRRILAEKLLNEHQVERVESLLAACDEARFSPSAAAAEEMRQRLDQVYEVFRQIK